MSAAQGAPASVAGSPGSAGASARLRHIVLAADDLAAELAIARAGLGLAGGIRDAGPMRKFDLEHEVLLLGSAYLEILAPLGNDRGTPAARFLARSGPGGYMLDLQVASLDAVLARVAGLGLAPVMRDVYRGSMICQLHPRDFGTLLEADQIADDPVTGPRDWHWDEQFPAGERAAQRAQPTGAVIAVADPAATAARWAAVFGGALEAGERVVLDGVTVSFAGAPGGRTGLQSVDVEVPAGSAAGDLMIAGVRFCRRVADAGE